MTMMVLVCFLTITSGRAQDTFGLHPENPRYFQFRGKPTVLVTSAEHYGAVLNLDFDYKKYLETLADDGLNYTRIFAGTYVEVPGSFNIRNNTLAPAPGRFITPWKRASGNGNFAGDPRWDLSQWNPDYFRRLRDFLREADRRGIVVEVTLFCSTYQDKNWDRSPLNAANNTSEIPEDLDRKQSTTPLEGPLAEAQAKLVEKLVQELNPFDNFFFEIQNENFFDQI